MSNRREYPYNIKQVVTEIRLYNPKFGDDRVCKCGHTYERHFDLHEEVDEQDVGCKYCNCSTFVENQASEMQENVSRLQGVAK